MKSNDSILLGVNVDHIASVRQSRGTHYPNLIEAASVAEQAGADAITVHLREDRRHIQDSDIKTLIQTINTRMNLEMAVTEEMIKIAEKIKPTDCCLVPEKREELTTEGGLDVYSQLSKVKEACKRLADAGIRVSLFVDADDKQILAAAEAGAPVIEIHTGHFADAEVKEVKELEYKKILRATQVGVEAGLQVNAGHGLHYQNTHEIAVIPDIKELNIGHAIVARALFVGLDKAVSEMKQIMLAAR